MWTRSGILCDPEGDRLFPRFVTIAQDLKEHRNYDELGQSWNNTVLK